MIFIDNVEINYFKHIKFLTRFRSVGLVRLSAIPYIRYVFLMLNIALAAI